MVTKNAAQGRRKLQKSQKAPTKKAKSKIPDRIFANASPRSIREVSLLPGMIATSHNVVQVQSEAELTQRAVCRLIDAGFEVLSADSVKINIAGTRETFEKAFNTRLVAKDG